MIRFVALALFVTANCALTAQAGRFLIDLQGAYEGGHLLQVAGTMDVDPSTDSVLSSDLTFIHDSDRGVQLPSLPRGTGGNFVVEAGTLFIESGATRYSELVWEDVAFPLYEFSFLQGPGIGDAQIRMVYEAELGHYDLVSQVGWGERLMVGTAVPEPSAFTPFLLVAAYGGMFNWWRRRRISALIRRRWRICPCSSGGKCA